VRSGQSNQSNISQKDRQKYMKKFDKKYKTNLATPLNIISSNAYKTFAGQNLDKQLGSGMNKVSPAVKLDH